MEYTPDDYNEYGILKVPMGLIFALLYSIKHYVLVVALALGARRSLVLQSVMSDMEKSFVLLAGTIPALFVIAAMLKRQPGAPPILRLIWKYGILLISATLLFDAAFLGYLQTFSPQRTSLLVLLLIFFDIWFIVYLLTTRRVRQVFREFPESR